jgi:ketosteroid isomerase-like protein
VPETLDAAETRLQHAQRTGDVDALDALLHTDAVYVGPDGSETTREADLEAHRSGILRLTGTEELSRSVTEFGDAGISRVRVHLVGEAGGQALDAVLVYTRTWVRADGEWQVVQAHGVVAPYAVVPPGAAG